MTRKTVRIGIAGLGTVGCGLIELVQNQNSLRLNRRIEIVGVSARNRSAHRDVDIKAWRWFDDPVALACLDDVDVFVELIGGANGIARNSIEAALQRGTNVVTANKALLAEHGTTLATLAHKHSAGLRFEAAVCGGAPVVGPLRDILCAAQIKTVRGILNGTCNDILCRMESDGLTYADALEHAQKLGYAEADPHLDVSGTDAAHKISLLASIAFAAKTDMKQIAIAGIERIRRIDMIMARSFGYRIKLIARAVNTSSGILCSVGPELMHTSDPLSHIHGALNAVDIQTTTAGSVTICGQGAGREPTALSVMADIAASEILPETFGMPVNALTTPLVREQLDKSPQYIRAYLKDSPGAMACLTQTLAAAGVSIDTLQQGEADHTGLRPVAMITHPCPNRNASRAEHLAAQLPVCAEPPLTLTVGK